MENAINSEAANGVLVRRRSKVHLYVHLVWRTHGSEPFIIAQYERQVYRAIAGEAIRLGCKVIAINGMPDHVHLLVRLPSVLCPSVLIKQVKGTSSATINALKRSQDPFAMRFRWQDGYACLSVGISEIDRVAAYVRGQKRHHAHDNLWADWEETDEDFALDNPLPGGYLAEGP